MMKDRFGFDWSGVAGTHFWKRPQLSRRLFFRHVASAVGGYFLLPSRPMETIARAQATPVAKAKNCIFVLMAGAPSHIDTFDLKEGPWTPAAFEPTSYNAVRFPRGLMPKIADQLGSIALARSVRSWGLVHGLGQTWLQIGRNPLSSMAKIAPHVGSIVSLEMTEREGRGTLPTFLSLNAGSGPESGYFPPVHAPFYVSPGGAGLGNTQHREGAARFDTRYSLLEDIDAGERGTGKTGAAGAESLAFHHAARKLMYNPEVDRVFTFDAAERARYGTTGFGNACLTARNLLRARLGTRFIQITVGGWDQHSNIYAPNGGITVLGRQFDNGLGTLIADLKNDGLLDETLIVALGEFGRTIGQVNNQGGRDHFLQQAALFAGAGINGPRAIGSSDDRGALTADPGWSRNRDIRTEDIEATLYSALGIDWTTTRRDDPLGRGFEYVPTTDRDIYYPIHELWG